MKIGKIAFFKGFVIIGVLLIGIGLTACDTEKGSQTSVKTVSLQTVGKSMDRSEDGVSGNIVPVDTTKISFKVAGVIEAIYVKEGDVVKKGDALAKIKPKDYELSLKASKAQYESAKMSIDKDIPNKLAQAKAQLDLSQVTYDRLKALYDNGAVSKSDLDQITAKLKVDTSTYQQAMDASVIARTELGQAKAAYDLAVDNLKETTIYSPMNGIVLKKMSSEGEVQAAGYPVVVVGSQTDVWAEFGVTDAQVGQFKIGQSWPVYVYGVDKTMEGIVSEIGALADEKTRLFTVKLKLSNQEGRMKAGMIAKANFNQVRNEEILVPFLSVVHLAKGDVVYLYDSEKKTVHEQIIQTGNLIDDRIEVVSGLKLGDKIVTEGQYQIGDGEQVNIND